MDKDSKEKLKSVLSAIDPVEFTWKPGEVNMSSGVMSESIDDCITITSGASITGHDTITIDPNTFSNLGNVTIASGGPSISYSTIANGGFTIGSNSPSIGINCDNGRNYIKTPKHEIDLDELGDLMETLKKRLLILTPAFEMHEKYPMLKELYDEYKALEKLLSGPDHTPEE